MLKQSKTHFSIIVITIVLLMILSIIFISVWVDEYSLSYKIILSACILGLVVVNWGYSIVKIEDGTDVLRIKYPFHSKIIQKENIVNITKVSPKIPPMRVYNFGFFGHLGISVDGKLIQVKNISEMVLIVYRHQGKEKQLIVSASMP